MEKTGYVRKKPFAVGSKSEREAVVLVTPSREYVLGRQGCNQLQDEELEQLVGKKVRFRGVEHSYKFLVSDWEEVE
jgi:hypothetical protein